MTKLVIAPGVFLWREKFSPAEQKKLRDDVMVRLEQAPLYRPVMPDTGKPFSVEESNFGKLGWVSDKSGYRYQPIHPVTGAPWPAIPQLLLDVWDEINAGPQPESCLVNLYRSGAKMGLHQDRDEKDVTAAVIGVSLGDEALFRIGGTFKNGKWGRGGKTVSVTLASGDVIAFGGVARLAYHGIDRVKPGTSQLLAGGGRLSLTLRRVSLPFGLKDPASARSGASRP
ncbi:MAG TPA: alpha-ketoglutarate-dependent dioxygenase AlkB [Rhizomicrobium sp.]|nr:alpha-ketoglutarate-dependent dioxygenase AlkB [Rhizomicrobium sp.]